MFKICWLANYIYYHVNCKSAHNWHFIFVTNTEHKGFENVLIGTSLQRCAKNVNRVTELWTTETNLSNCEEERLPYTNKLPIKTLERLDDYHVPHNLYSFYPQSINQNGYEKGEVTVIGTALHELISKIEKGSLGFNMEKTLDNTSILSIISAVVSEANPQREKTGFIEID